MSTSSALRQVNGGAGKAESLVDHVVERIIEQVRRGKLVPGQRLVASDLAEAFNVSRAPVREALHVLAGEGVVRLVQNRGAVITSLTPAELLDFLEFTTSICALGMRRAAPKMSEAENRKTILAVQRDIEVAGEKRNADNFINSLYLYHKAVNRIAGNAFLDFFYSRPYFVFYNRLLADYIPGDRWEEYLEHYRHLTAVLLGEKEPDPETEFQKHMEWASELLLKNSERDL